jgi:Membrane protein involved in the export of O-antigen and teichoic acid
MGIIVRQSIKGTFVNYIGVAIGFITTFFVVTKYLPPEVFGLVSVLIDASVLFSGLSQLGTTASAMRYYPYFKDPENKDNGFFGWTLIVPIVGFLFFSIVFFLCKDWIIEQYTDNSALFVDYIYYVIPLGLFMLYLSIFETNSNLLMHIVVPKFIREVGIRVLLLAAYLLFAFKILSIKGLVISVTFTFAVALLLNVFYLLSLRKVSFKIKPSFITNWLRKDFLFYSFFLMAASLAGNIAPFLNKFFLAGMDGLDVTGIFAIAVNIALVVEMPYRSLSAISSPHISQALSTSEFKQADALCKSVSLHQFLAGSFIFIAIWINIDLFFNILPNGEVYEAGKWVVFILGISRLLKSTLNVGSTVLSYSKYYYFSLVFTIILTALSILLNQKLIPIYGMEGAAIATLGAYAIYYTMLLAFTSWKIHTSPISFQEFKVLIVVLAIFGLNWLWTNWLTATIVSLFPIDMVGRIVEAILRTGFVLTVGVLVVYKMRVSVQVNTLIDKIIHFKIRA